MTKTDEIAGKGLGHTVPRRTLFIYDLCRSIALRIACTQ